MEEPAKARKPEDHQLRCDTTRAAGGRRGDRRRSRGRTTHAWSHTAGGGARRWRRARSARRRAARQRNRASADARSAHHAARRSARAPASHRIEEGLRPRPVRRLHGADGRQAREILPLARRPRRGARDHDHRRPGPRRPAPSAAGRLHRARRLPVRLLHVRADHGRRRLHQRGPRRLGRRRSATG